MNISNILVQSKLLKNNSIQQQTLKNGSQVLVRIIADKGDGKYEGSVAGARIQLTAKNPITVGSSFLATINVENGKIQLIPQNNENLIVKQNMNFVELNNSNFLLNALGLPEDELSFQVVQQFKQMEMKFDSGLMQQLRKTALKFGDKKKSALEILSLLAEKKIKGTDEEILQLLMELEDDREFLPQSDKEGNSFKLLNTINKTEGKWFIVPFNIVRFSDNLGSQNKDCEKEEILGNGIIRLLFNGLKNIKLLNIDCNYKTERYLFSLTFDKTQLVSIRMNDSTGYDKNKILLLQKKIDEKFSEKDKSNVLINWAEKEELEGSACGNEKLMAVDGIV